jgi:hypothetical protein
MSEKLESLFPSNAADCSGLLELVEAYKTAVTNLDAYRVKTFRSGMFVKVNCDRYHGYGFIVRNSDCPPHVVPVKLENGNTWWYPIESVMPVEAAKSVPRSNRRSKLKHHGYKLTGCVR